MDSTEGKNFSKGIFFLLLFISVIVGACVLKVMSKVLVVITIAVLLSFIFYPLVKKICRITRIPWVLTSFIVLLIFLLLMLFTARILASSLMSIISLYPNYENRFNNIYQTFTKTFNIPFDKEISLWRNMWNQVGIRNFLQNLALSLSGNVINFIKSLGMTLLFSFFLLSEMRIFKLKLHTALEGQVRGRVTNIVLKTITQVTQYVSIKALASLLTGILVFAICAISGLDFPLVWGILAFIMNFIPTFGSIISCATTILFAIIQFYPNPVPILFTSVGITTVNIVIGNFLEPIITGDHIDLSPFAILVSLSVWGWLWGFPGMLIAVPMLVIIKIVCENISFLKPVAILLGTGKIKKKKKLPGSQE